MAFIYRKRYTTVDPKTGAKVTRRRKNYRIRYRDPDGVMQDVPGFKDRESTKQLAAELERMVARQRVGLVDRFDLHRKRLLTEHLDEFEAHLKAKGNTPKHVDLKVTRIQAALDGCGFQFIQDLVPSRLEGWLAERRAAGAISAQTSNHYLTCVKAFTRWLVMDRRTADNPFIGLRGVNAKLDPRHQRRVLSLGDLGKLLSAAKKGKPYRGLSGKDRVLLYRIALYTGFRLNEIATLTPESFDLQGDPPTVAVEAGYSKRRKRDVQVLRSDLTKELKRWLRRKPKGERVFPGTWMNRASTMVKRDLASAGIAYQDDSGAFFDFHALRHVFISSLAASGVHPKVAQELARHSDINLTLSRYTHLSRQDEQKAVEGLPEIGGKKKRRRKSA